ncbi:MAG: PLDc N-terminal domain-containing protein [Clostridia bacterium]|nr:PLDc N-terminal domain-containing protein [Clostridia bacterium]
MDKTTIIMMAVPLIIIQFGLQLTAMVKLIKNRNIKAEQKAIWAIVIVISGYIGSIVYFVARKDD